MAEVARNSNIAKLCGDSKPAAVARETLMFEPRNPSMRRDALPPAACQR
jgi:hypothetical protein